MPPENSTGAGDRGSAGAPSEDSRERVTAIFDSMAEGFAGIGFDWRYTYLNQSAVRFLRKPREQLIGQDVFRAFPEAKGTAFEGCFRKALDERVPQSVEAFYEPLQSWFECRCYPSPEGIAVLFIDSTEKKRREEERGIYHEMIRNANSAIILWKRDGTISFFNEFAQELFGYRSEEIIGRHVGVLVPETESSGAELTGLVRDIVTHPERYMNYINENVCRDGRRVWMTWTNKAIFDNNGQVAEILAVGNDVTRLKLADEALRQSEERYRALFDTMTEGFALHEIITGTDGRPCDYRFLDVNPAFERLTGFKREDLIGRRMLEILPPTESHWIDKYARVALTGEPVHTESFSAALGHWYDVYAYRTAPGRFAVIFSDSTDRKRMEHELRKSRDELEITVRKRTAELQLANDRLREENRERIRTEQSLRLEEARLEALNQELQDFAFTASHDLSEPLRKIKAFGDLIARRIEGFIDEVSKDYLERMQAAAARMQKLLDSLLSYSRVTTEAVPMMPTDLGSVVEEALSNLEVLIEEKGAEVEVSDLTTLEADRIQLIQLFQNLIGNALKYHREGEAPRVRIYSHKAGDEEGVYETCVEDNGIGFEDKYIDKIFLPFQRLHGRSSVYEGVGMGLAICRKIVKRHGGDITARSKPGEGSTFIVTLPGSRNG